MKYYYYLLFLVLVTESIRTDVAVPNKPVCSTVHSFKIEDIATIETPQNLTYALGLSDNITFYNVDVNAGTIDSWSTTGITINAIILKGGIGNAAAVYTYDPTVDSDSDMIHTQKMRHIYTCITYIEVCWDFKTEIAIDETQIHASYDIQYIWNMVAKIDSSNTECINEHLCKSITNNIDQHIALLQSSDTTNMTISGSFKLKNTDIEFDSVVSTITASFGEFPLTVTSCDEGTVVMHNKREVVCTFRGSNIPLTAGKIFVRATMQTGSSAQNESAIITPTVNQKIGECIDITAYRVGAMGIISTQHLCAPQDLAPITATERFDTPGRYCITYKIDSNAQELLIGPLCYCLPAANSIVIEPIPESFTAHYNRKYTWALTSTAPSAECFGGKTGELINGGNLKDSITITNSYVDTDHQFNGRIKITNPDSYCTALIQNVTGDSHIKCQTDISSLAPGMSMTCEFKSTVSPTTVAVATSVILPASLTILAPIWVMNNTIDNCVTINDVHRVCANESISLPDMMISETFTETGTFCKIYPVSATNARPIQIHICYCVTSDGHTDQHVPVNGCIYLPSHWLNHTDKWPIGLPESMFYFSGVTWLQTFSYNSIGNNCYWKIAHENIVAHLNSLIANAPQTVITTLATINAKFSTASRYWVDKGSWCSATGTPLHAILKQYNDGLMEEFPLCE